MIRNARALPFLLAGSIFATGIHATEAEHIHASQAWIRVLPGDLPAGAYVTLENTSDQPAMLRSATTPRYASVMLHKSSSEGGVSRMAMVESLAIPAHGKAELSPGGYHLMLSKAGTPLSVGENIKITLHFADGSTLDTDFVARPANATDAGDAHH
ncbi:MAG TPA: copper chaperone PCu(A)C [Dyella sp.]|nr:copper chaperone PCu(A)C [Dyella sp.]HET6551970.1 copper chaperone PCu(A)C [Dyella sp.]